MKTRTIPLPFGAQPLLDFEANASFLEVVAVKPGEAPSIELDATAEPEVRLDGEVVRVRPSPRSLTMGWELAASKVTLRVPPQLKARISADLGRAVISGLAGCDLEVSTQAGSLELHEVRGRLKLKANAGQIRGDRLGGSFEIECGAGSVRLGIVALDAGEHRVHSNMGSVRIDLAPGLEVRIDSHTVMGSTRTRYPSNPRAAAVLKLEAELGSVRVGEGEGEGADDPRHGDWPDWRKLWAAAEAFVTAPVQRPTPPGDEELRKILGMVEAGKLNAAEAERLIRAIST